jgi:mannan endo-1,4-beta-mannosidase
LHKNDYDQFILSAAMLFKILLLTTLLSWSCTEGLLTVNGTNFYYNNEKVFLSGVNGAWVSYGYDFGNRMFEYNANATTREWFTRIAAAGGNSIRNIVVILQ